MDLFSRKVVGWPVSTEANSVLVCKSVKNTLVNRRIFWYILFNRNRGTQFSSDETQDFLISHEIKSSMSPKGDPWSNAVQENFFQKLKQEYIKSSNFISVAEAKRELFWYIEVFYNIRRHHKCLGYLIPSEYEKRHEVVT